MRDAFGGSFMIMLFLVFIMIYISFTAVTLSYAKAFKVKNKVIDYLESKEITDLTRMTVDEQQEIEDLKLAQENNRHAFKDIIRTYESMSPKRAAQILTAIEEEEAIKVLSKIKADELSAILEKMDPADAARIMQKLGESSIVDNG